MDLRCTSRTRMRLGTRAWGDLWKQGIRGPRNRKADEFGQELNANEDTGIRASAHIPCVSVV